MYFELQGEPGELDASWVMPPESRPRHKRPTRRFIWQIDTDADCARWLGMQS